MKVEDYLKYKFSTHHDYRTKKIITNSYYFKNLLEEYNNLSVSKTPDFILYANEKIPLDIEEYSSEYNEIRDKEYYNYKLEFVAETLDEKYFAVNYLEMNSIKTLDSIFKKFDKIERDFFNEQFDRYKEVESFISFIEKSISILKNDYAVFALELLLKDNGNKQFTIHKLINANSFNTKQSDLDNWEGFKDNLNLEINKILPKLRKSVSNYNPEDIYTPPIKNRIIKTLIDENLFYEWNEIFNERNMYDSLIDNFYKYSQNENSFILHIKIKSGIKTNFSKVIRKLHSEISNNETLINDIEFFNCVRTIKIYENESNQSLYKILTK